MVATAIALLCVAVAAFGVRLRGAKEPFGNVLVGLAAGGLYVDAVGANLYPKLITGEAMVAACLGVSLATLGFGARRALPSFLGVGLFGGLLAAAMPLSKGSVGASCVLLLLVSASVFAVGAVRRWPVAITLAWTPAFGLALILLYGFSGDHALRVGTMAALLLLGCAAWGWAAERSSAFDPNGAFAYAAAGVAGWALIPMYGVPFGAALVALLGALLSSIGLLLKGRAGGRPVALAGLLLALVVAPFGLRFFAIPAVLGGLAILEAAVFRRRVAPLVALQAGVAVGVYGVLLLFTFSEGRVARYLLPIEETGLLALLAAASLVAAILVDRKEARVAAGVAIWGLLTRAAVLALPLPGSAATTAAWTLVLAGLLVVGFWRRRPELRALGLFVAAATATKLVFVDLAGLDAALKAAALMGLGLVLLAGGWAYVRHEAGTAPPPER